MSRRAFYRLALLCTVVLAMATVGWAKTYPMTSTGAVPGAAGNVNVSKAKHGNIQIVVKVRHLSKPGMLTPPANTYVVWLQGEGAQPQSLGEMKVGDNLKGALRASTPLGNFTVFITAEIDSQTTTPSNQVVLRARVQE
ncbi:MAG TPA: anti-sigma factor [Candidatus Dormibacteraeota bacterium]|nr:anti-sigma factor [Candidatus Dormibacteraeota bacterium]